MNIDDALNIIGSKLEKSESEGTSDNCTVITFRNLSDDDYGDDHIYAIVKNNHVTALVNIGLPIGITPEGIHINSSRADLMSAYPSAIKVSGPAGDDLVAIGQDGTQAYVFGILDTTDRVTSLSAMSSRDAQGGTRLPMCSEFSQNAEAEIRAAVDAAADAVSMEGGNAINAVDAAIDATAEDSSWFVPFVVGPDINARSTIINAALPIKSPDCRYDSDSIGRESYDVSTCLPAAKRTLAGFQIETIEYSVNGWAILVAGNAIDLSRALIVRFGGNMDCDGNYCTVILPKGKPFGIEQSGQAAILFLPHQD